MVLSRQWWVKALARDIFIDSVSGGQKDHGEVKKGWSGRVLGGGISLTVEPVATQEGGSLSLCSRPFSLHLFFEISFLQGCRRRWHKVTEREREGLNDGGRWM